MRFLLNMNVPRSLAALLAADGHAAVTQGILGWAGPPMKRFYGKPGRIKKLSLPTTWITALSWPSLANRPPRRLSFGCGTLIQRTCLPE